MGEILNIIEKLSGGKCYYSDRYTLDHFVPEEYQDKNEEFSGNVIFEDENPSGNKVQLNPYAKTASIFKYFLDGSRRTYKIVDFATSDQKLLPIVAGQIGTAVCYRYNKKIHLHKLRKQNVLSIPDRIGDEFETIVNELKSFKKHNVKINNVFKYQYKKNINQPLENKAIAKVQFEMLEMEIDLISSMVDSNLLKSDQMLIIDGSLQYSKVSEDNEYIFKNVIGISKSFNPHINNILKSKKKEIGYYLTNLKFGERTPVYFYFPQGTKNIQIGAWYLRIRENKFLNNPLDGVIKIEKIATTQKEKEDGFATETINEISRAILLERNVVSYGKDDRWANHLYPIYLTELLLKKSFLSDLYFLNIF